MKAASNTEMTRNATTKVTLMLRLEEEVFAALKREAFEEAPDGTQMSVQERIRVILKEHVTTKKA